MRIIKSFEVSDTILTASNIPEDDAAAWVSAASYTANQQVMYNHKIYTAILTHSGQTTNPSLDTTRWLDSGYNNRYRMFDKVISNTSTKEGGITFSLTPNQATTAIAFLNIRALSVTVQVQDPVLGNIYEKTEILSSLEGTSTYYEYFFAPIGDNKLTAVFLDLPESPTATINVTINSGAGLAEIGEVVFGTIQEIGRTNYGTTIGIKSYSRKEVDEFGNITVVKRKNSKYAEYDIDIDNYKLAAVQRYFMEIDSVPSVFIGNTEMEELIVFGFYSDFKATISFPTVSKCTLRVEGLI